MFLCCTFTFLGLGVLVMMPLPFSLGADNFLQFFSASGSFVPFAFPRSGKKADCHSQRFFALSV